MRRLFKRLQARWGPAFQSDTGFIEAAFREILGRNADLDGLTHYRRIPAFGDDPVFGTVFPLYLDRWQQDASAGRPFSTLHVDDLGYPIHGHLTWADANWWRALRAAGIPARDRDRTSASRQVRPAHEMALPGALRVLRVLPRDAGLRREDVIRQITAERSRVTS